MLSSAISNLGDLNTLVLDLMYEMDQETGPWDGDHVQNYPVGLWGYAHHAQPGRTPYQSEVCWSTRLAEMLDQRGFSATGEFYYPDSRQRCDIRVDIGLEQPVWIEVKGSWRAKFDPPSPSSAYGKHLNATAEDVVKLNTLSSNEASATALVLAGFDQPNAGKTIGDADIAKIRGLTKDAGWVESYRTWDVCNSLSFRVQCWIWSHRL